MKALAVIKELVTQLQPTRAGKFSVISNLFFIE